MSSLYMPGAETPLYIAGALDCPPSLPAPSPHGAQTGSDLRQARLCLENTGSQGCTITPGVVPEHQTCQQAELLCAQQSDPIKAAPLLLPFPSEAGAGTAGLSLHSLGPGPLFFLKRFSAVPIPRLSKDRRAGSGFLRVMRGHQ